jgi:DNA-binding NarL/FixJ family response regulator
MTVKTCLLVSDDPDDQAEFTEALSEISEEIIAIVLADPKRAADLVLSKRHIPDYMIVDLSVDGISQDDFFSRLASDRDFEEMVVIAFGDDSEYEGVKSGKISAFLERDSAYSDMRKFLRRVIRGDAGLEAG